MNKTIRRLALIGIAVPAFGLLGVAPADALLPPPTPEDPTDPGDTGGGASGGTSTYQATADFNGDGGSDSCVVTSADAKATCTVRTPPAGGTTGVNITYSTKVDPGWMAGRAWVDHNGDGKADYCRVVDYTPARVHGLDRADRPAGHHRPPAAVRRGLRRRPTTHRTWTRAGTTRGRGGTRTATARATTAGSRATSSSATQASCTVSNGQGFTAESLRIYF